MIDAIFAAHELNQEVIAFIETIVAECGKPKHEYESFAVPEELFDAIRAIVPAEEMEEAVFTDDKQTREENIRKITERLEEAFADNEEWLAKLGEAVYQYQKKTVRKMILKDHKRPDGRAIDEIRPLAAEIDLIPRVHGSPCLPADRHRSATLQLWLRFLTHRDWMDWMRQRHQEIYASLQFPVLFCRRDQTVQRTGRREIGHGALAERALIPVLPSEAEFPYAIRTVSETFESNGSTSQASVCASSMSLMAAGVPDQERGGRYFRRTCDRRYR